MGHHVLMYHYPCPDGVFAGLSAWLRLASDGGSSSSVRVAPQVSFKTPLERAASVQQLYTKEDTVHLLDFSGGMEFILALCAHVKHVKLVDHHKTAAEDIAALGKDMPPNLEVHFDMARSGATMARDVYNVQTVLQAKLGAEGAARVLRLYDYIEDHDLWKHALPDSKEFSAGFAAMQLEFDASKNAVLWDTLLSLDADVLIAKGREKLAEEERIVAAEVAQSFPVKIPYALSSQATGAALADGPLPVPAVMNCLAIITTHPDLRSSLGNALAEKSLKSGLAAAAAVVYEEPGFGDDKAQTWYKVSMRSIGDVDTTAVSRAYGGGGHRNASSFNVERSVWAGWVVN